MGAMPSLGASKEKEDKKEKVTLALEEKQKTMEKVKPQTKPKKKKRVTKKGFVYDLTKEPSDIRNAVLNRRKNNEKCYYFFYKRLPGAGEPERFRRERDCDDFEFDL